MDLSDRQLTLLANSALELTSLVNNNVEVPYKQFTETLRLIEEALETVRIEVLYSIELPSVDGDTVN
jgi:hypothetical protein